GLKRSTTIANGTLTPRRHSDKRTSRHSGADQVVAAAMIDRIVHHADVLTLKGSSYRLKDTGIDTLPSARADNTAQ
ncbi:ATP-binding protein, partial [Mycolicibacterium novocastrense]|uniref:ATP-binding protein n=1 Tax=Mycolicibacterium novocastrense TaxID=59813 RepID=UPI000A8FD97B